MSAPHIILYFCHLCDKNCQIWWKFYVVITKIILLVFFCNTVYIQHRILQTYILTPRTRRLLQRSFCVASCQQRVVLYQKSKARTI